MCRCLSTNIIVVGATVVSVGQRYRQQSVALQLRQFFTSSVTTPRERRRKDLTPLSSFGRCTARSISSRVKVLVTSVIHPDRRMKEERHISVIGSSPHLVYIAHEVSSSLRYQKRRLLSTEPSGWNYRRASGVVEFSEVTFLFERFNEA